MNENKFKLLENFSRFDLVNLLNGENNVGIELGVAEGEYSKELIASGKFKKLFGVDCYESVHGKDQYKRALKTLVLPESNKYILMKMFFDEALDLFEDRSLDFIYIDGFAHSGEEGGKTMFDWYKKLKIGGIIGGDDFHSDWPLVKLTVKDFVQKTNEKLMLTEVVNNSSQYSKYPSWAIKKSSLEHENIFPSKYLLEICSKESNRVSNLRSNPVRLFLRKISPIWLRPYLGKIAGFLKLQ